MSGELRSQLQGQHDLAQRLIRNARCLLWEAEVEQELSGKLCWHITIGDERAAQRVLPLEVRPGEGYVEGWRRSALAEDQVRVQAYAEERILTDEPYTLEYRCRCRNGEIRWLRDEVEVERVRPGCWRAVGVTVDVSDQKRAEQVRSQLLAVMEATPDLISTCEPDGRLLYLNAAARQIFGIPRSGDLGRRRVQQCHPAWTNRVIEEQAIPAAVERGAWQGETAILAADGREIPVSQVITAHRSSDGRVKFLSTISRDISSRKRFEDALREAESRFRVIAEASPIGIFLMDPSGAPVYLNPEALRHVGTGPVAGNAWLNAIHPADRENVTLNWERALATGTRFEHTFRFQHRDAGIVWVEMSTAPLQENGAVVGYLGVSTDITRRRDLEEQLRQAQKMEAVGRLAGGVAHDFNNMLAVINGYSDLLLRRVEGTSTMQGPLHEIREAGRRAAALTRQLLAYSRRQLLESREFDLNEVVVNVNMMLHRLIGEDIKLVSVPAPRPVCVSADPGQIEQVVVNLVVNARDAMHNGGRIVIRVEVVELAEGDIPHGTGLEPGSYGCVEVSDTGCGMSEDTLSHIFEPFFTTKGVGEGTGLGLSTAYGTLKQSGGHIAVKSELGRGSTFCLYLPQVEGEGEVSAPAVHPPVGLAEGCETILLVEDEDMVRCLTRTILEQSGYRVLEAPDGETALRLCEDHRGGIDLVISDVVMPGMSGTELGERVRSLRSTSKLLFMSGYTDERVLGHDFTPGAFIQKPFTPAALAQKVWDPLESTCRHASLSIL